MRRRLELAALALIGATLAGCSSSGETPPERREPTTARRDGAANVSHDTTATASHSRATTATSPGVTTDVARSTSPLPVGRRLVSVAAEDAPVHDVVDSIARQAGVNIAIDPSVTAKVSISLRDIDWREAVLFIADRSGCELSELRDGVLDVVDPPRVTISGDTISRE